MNPLSGATQVFSWETGLLEVTITLPPLSDAQARRWIGFLSQLRGTNVFEFGDPLGQQPFGTPLGSPVVDGNQSGVFSLET